MQPYGGLVVVINYAGQTEAEQHTHHLIAQDGADILTQASENILVQAA
jgi:hypothetical protein